MCVCARARVWACVWVCVCTMHYMLHVHDPRVLTRAAICRTFRLPLQLSGYQFAFFRDSNSQNLICQCMRPTADFVSTTEAPEIITQAATDGINCQGEYCCRGTCVNLND